MDRGTNTLALGGLEEPFFQLCCCVMSVFGSVWKCGNLLDIIFQWIVFESSGKIVFGVTCVLSVQYSCAGVSVFLLWR
jgi:hypothetical protein